MFKKLKGILSSILDIKSLLTFFGITSISSIFYYGDIALDYFYSNVPIILVISLIMILIAFNILFAKIMAVEKTQRIITLESRVDSLYKQHSRDPITDKWIVKGLEKLEAERVELGVNSFTQGKLEIMLSNIDYDTIYQN